MAGAIKLTEVDFDQIKNNLIDYLQSTGRFTDFDFEGSNLQVILNLIAYHSQLNAYTTNMLANESFLASSTIRTNVVENANMLGYLPTSARASYRNVNFEYRLNISDYPQGLPTYLEIRPGTLMSCSNGNQAFMFNIIDTQVAAVTSAGVCQFFNVKATEGIIITIDFEVDYTTPNQKYVLENENIDTTTIKIEVQEDPNEESTTYFQQANNLVELTEETRAFWVEETRDQHYEIKFGDGYFGRKLKNGAKIHVQYIVTNGDLANGDYVTNKESFIGKTYDSFGYAVTKRPQITSVSRAVGGSPIEDTSSIKLRAPRYYAAQNRCVTTEDYETIIRQIYPEVQDIYVYGGETLDIPQYGRVYISIKPRAGESISMITEKYIRESLQAHRVASIDLAFVDPTVLYVELDSTVYYDEKQTSNDQSIIVAKTVDRLDSFINSSVVSKFGGVASHSVVSGIIDHSDDSITRNITSFRLRKDIVPAINADGVYECCFDNEIYKNEEASSFATTGFRQEIDGKFDERVYYMEDDSQGNIRSFYFTKNNTKVIADKFFGTIDYKAGRVQVGYTKPLKIINVTTNNSLLEFRAIPKDRDIIAKESIFLQMDLAKSSIGATPDTQIPKS